MFSRTTDNPNPPAWARRYLALKAVAKRAELINAFDEDDWTVAFTDAEAETMVEFFEATAGIEDALGLLEEFPDDADVHGWARTLVELESAVEQLASVAADGHRTGNVHMFIKEMRSDVSYHMAAFGKFHISRLTGEAGR